MKKKNRGSNLTQEELNSPEFPLVVQCLLAREIRDLIVEKLMGGLIKPGGTFSVNEYRKIIVRSKKSPYLTETTQLPDEETALQDEEYVKLFTAKGDAGTITTDQSLFEPLIKKYIRESTPYKLLDKMINEFNDEDNRLYRDLRAMNNREKKNSYDFEIKLGVFKDFELQLDNCREFLNEIQYEAARITTYQSEKLRQNPNLKSGAVGFSQPVVKTMEALTISLMFKSEEEKIKRNFCISNNEHRKSLYIMFFEALRNFFAQKQAADNFLRKCYCMYFGNH